MAKRPSRGRKVSGRRTGSTAGRSKRGATRRAPAAKRSTRKFAPKRNRASGRAGRRSAAPQAIKIVLETSETARAGEAVGIGQKVAPTPRLKPRF
jgi:hypothetical protein